MAKKIKPIKIKFKVKNNETIVRTLMPHPMDTGLVTDKKTGKKIPAHFIQEVVAKKLNVAEGAEPTQDTEGAVVFSASFGGAVSKNPYLSFKLKDMQKGDVLSIGWTDNQGQTMWGYKKVK